VFFEDIKLGISYSESSSAVNISSGYYSVLTGSSGEKSISETKRVRSVSHPHTSCNIK